MTSQRKSKLIFNFIVIISMLLQSSAAMAAPTIPSASVSPAAQESAQEDAQVKLITQYGASETQIGSDWTLVDLFSSTPAEPGATHRVLFKYVIASDHPAAIEMRIHSGAEGSVASLPIQEITTGSFMKDIGEVPALAGVPAEGPWRLEARTTAGTAVTLSGLTLQVEQFVKGNSPQMEIGEAGTPVLMRLPEGLVSSAKPVVPEEPSGTSGGIGTADTTIMTQNFEGTFPAAGWTVFDNDNNGSQQFWDDEPERPYAGLRAAWMAGGGANALQPGPAYINNMSSWMVYGPFSLSDASSAKAVFQLWYHTEAGYDHVYFGASPDGSSFYMSDPWNGNSGGWVQKTVDFSAFAGDSSVWVAWIFTSDVIIANFEGSWVDNITVSKSDAPPPPPSNQCTSGFSDSVELSSEELMAAYQAAIDQADPALLQDARPYEILLESRRFVPPPAVNTSAMDLAAAGGSGSAHVLLQFYNTPTEEQKEGLKAQGIELLHYIPSNAWIASVQQNSLAALSADASIRWGGVLTPEDRTSVFLADERLRAFYANADETLPLMVEFAKDVPLERAKEIVAGYGGVVLDEMLSINALLIDLPQNNFDALTRVDEIIWIEPPLPRLEALNDCVRDRMGGDTLQTSPYNLNGSGVDLLVYDGGTVAPTHGAFTGRLSVRDNSGQSDHATHVAGTAAGSGSGSPLGRNLKGMAPAANVISYGYQGFEPGWLYTNPGDIESDWNAAKNSYGADLGTASIGTNTAANNFPCEWEGNYGAVAQLLDAIVGGSLGEPYIATWAAGNERGNGRCGTSYGTTAPPSGAKNPIHVGATNSDTDTITWFSSFGPTDDGRIKPTISAPGCEQGGDGGVNSAVPSNGYGVMCGTSMATPAVAGLVSLMIQQYRSAYSTAGEPLPSTIKALLIHTAVDRGNAGPDYQYGYGRVDGVSAIDAIIEGDFREESIAMTNEYHDYSFSQSGNTPLKVSIAWDDEPATPSAAVQLVNDLDLTLISPSNQTYRPFILNPANPGQAATTGADHLNNQEQIIVPSPESGIWTIRVRANNLPAAPQLYSIVFDNAFNTSPTINQPIPGTFNKSAPANGAIGQPVNVTLTWTASSGATSYEYCYDTTNDNACSNWTSNGASTSKLLSGLSSSTTYYWHVRALNGNGTRYANNSPTAFWSFKTRATPVQKTFTSITADGWVLESSEASNTGGPLNAVATTLRVGDEAGDKQYRSILSFNTAAVPDNAVITAITLKVKQQGLVGTNPFVTHGKLLLDIIRGAFSESPTLQAADFQAAAGQNGAASIPNAPSAGWYTKVLPSGAFTYINKAGVTQLRLRFAKDDNDDLAADYLRFFSGNSVAANRPLLIITYYVP